MLYIPRNVFLVIFYRVKLTRLIFAPVPQFSCHAAMVIVTRGTAFLSEFGAVPSGEDTNITK
jgi:hypothetical protein